MAKNEIIVKDGMFNINNRTNEKELVSDILKREFFDWMEQNGYDLDRLKFIFNGKKLSSSEQSRFNIIIRKSRQEINISLTEIILFFEESFNRFKKILSVFDGETKFELKKELSKKFHIKLEETNLQEILR